MINYIIEQWKNKKVTVGLIILGFLIANMVLTIGTSISVENYNLVMDRNCGTPEEQLIIKIDVKKENQSDKVIDLLEQCSAFGELQLTYNEKALLDDYKATYLTVPVIFQKEADWHIPIMKGRYFIDEDMLQDTKEIVIGKDIAMKHNINIGDTLVVNLLSYQVVGICGRSNRDTIWQNVMYVPFDDYVSRSAKHFNQPILITALLKEGKDEFIDLSKSIIEEAKKKNIIVTFKEYEGARNFSSVTNSITITVVSAIFIFIIAVINVTNLMIYWIMERKKSMGVMKALGASNQYIIKWIMLEIICMTFISSIVAIIFQLLLSFLIRSYLLDNQVSIQITSINIIVSSIIALVCGVIAAIFPAKQILRMNPADIMKDE